MGLIRTRCACRGNADAAIPGRADLPVPARDNDGPCPHRRMGSYELRHTAPFRVPDPSGVLCVSVAWREIACRPCSDLPFTPAPGAAAHASSDRVCPRRAASAGRAFVARLRVKTRGREDKLQPETYTGLRNGRGRDRRFRYSALLAVSAWRTGPHTGSGFEQPAPEARGNACPERIRIWRISDLPRRQALYR